jgi:myosin heavy subunit
MSRVELLKKIRNLEEAIQTRSKRLAQLNAMDDPEAIIEAVKIKDELRLLNDERSRLLKEAEILRALLENRLPELEKAYLDGVRKEKDVLARFYETCKELQAEIDEIKKIINQVHHLFIPYQNCCQELQITPKSVHLLDVPFLMQISRWIANFIGWYEKVQAK